MTQLHNALQSTTNKIPNHVKNELALSARRVNNINQQDYIRFSTVDFVGLLVEARDRALNDPDYAQVVKFLERLEEQMISREEKALADKKKKGSY